MRYGAGIDLGTTQTAAAVRHADGRIEVVRLGGRRNEIPSLVFVKPDGGLLIGDAAERRGLTEPGRLAREFKRRIGDPVPILAGGAPFSAHALTAKLLRHVVDTVTRLQDGAPAAIVVTHPANWGPYKKEQLDQAIRLADVGEVSTRTEPEAAALQHATARRIADGETVAVYDLGGGTFDVAVLRRDGDGFTLLGEPEGIEQLGGADFDEAVFAHVLEVLGERGADIDPDDPEVVAALTRLRRDCVEAKESLSFDTETAIAVALPGLHTQVRLNRSEFESMIAPSLADTISATRRAIRSAGITADDLSAILLAGGSSRIPLVAQLLSTEFQRPVVADPHPEHSIALGAAIATAADMGGASTPAAPILAAPVAAAQPSAASPSAASPSAASPSAATLPAAPDPVPAARVSSPDRATAAETPAPVSESTTAAAPPMAVPAPRETPPLAFQRGAASIPGAAPVADADPTEAWTAGHIPAVDPWAAGPAPVARAEPNPTALYGPSTAAWGADSMHDPRGYASPPEPDYTQPTEPDYTQPTEPGYSPPTGPGSTAVYRTGAMPAAAAPFAPGGIGNGPPPPAYTGNGAAPAPRRRKAVLVLAGLIVLVVLVGGGAAIYAFNRNRDDGSPDKQTAGGATPTPGSSAATPVFPAGDILVRVDTGADSTKDRVSKVYTFTPGKPGRTLLTGTQSGDALPKWSHTRDRIALTHNTGPGLADIYLMNADGSNRRKILEDVTGGRVTWSADDSKIAYVRKVEGVPQIFIQPLDGGDPTRLTSSAGRKDDPAWSADGESIIYWAERDGVKQIYELNIADPEEPGRLIVGKAAGPANDPAPSPDGSKILYTREIGAKVETSDIWIVNADGTDPHRLTSDPAREIDPTWSPDGTWLALVRGPYERPAVIAMRPDGTDEVPLTTPGQREGHPCWF